ncbi:MULTISPECIES: MFS transporter [Mycolicibacterium]|jgi:MFS family permease|uniref:Major facilitator superfamily MFS_1 n=2 Tax=Mycolicibacterium TaxID=1866885 RepID=A0A378SZ89_9MYCO|nr:MULTISPECIES: MFS transporter [Mycolicibacterium]KLI08823.1 major facilitator transporter [Mycolicibacterium senegalense]KLO48514.1 major facilitator transporter [Mycolicibacterium senegalense]MCV7338280.1 MFS transporter [Mycolicibacterium senegalense]MCW1824497.1 MFS transporter [Mycolicibacterium senegalense]MDR7290739.1 MFS family permease [Mycolicibacterium senegalense]
MSTGRWHQDITRTQWLVLAGTTLGWGLDGFAGSLYVLVLGPAMNELLPNSGIGTDGAAIGFYGGLTVALFLTGWATGGILFGMLADYFGRTRVLSVGILTYAVFSALAVFAETWWQLGILRFIAGLGSGVEAPVGAALIAESWRNRFRARAGGVMMAGYAAGFFMAAAAYALLGDHGWRAMMLLAGLPALVVWFIRRYVPEPPEIGAHLQARRERKALGRNHDHDRFVLRRLFTPPLLHPMLVCTALATGALISFWSVSTWYPQIIREMTMADGLGRAVADHRVAMAAMLFNAGGIIGYAAWGFVADAIGRKKAFLISFVVSAVAIAWAFPIDRTYTEMLVSMPLLGFGLFGALSGTFIYGPELFPPSVRATALAICNSVGRYVTALGPFTAGVIAASWFGGNLGIATASVSAIGLIAVVGLAFARETRGAPMPVDHNAVQDNTLSEKSAS